jgi:hypothetical protein
MVCLAVDIALSAGILKHFRLFSLTRKVNSLWSSLLCKTVIGPIGDKCARPGGGTKKPARLDAFLAVEGTKETTE